MTELIASFCLNSQTSIFRPVFSHTADLNQFVETSKANQFLYTSHRLPVGFLRRLKMKMQQYIIHLAVM